MALLAAQCCDRRETAMPVRYFPAACHHIFHIKFFQHEKCEQKNLAGTFQNHFAAGVADAGRLRIPAAICTGSQL